MAQSGAGFGDGSTAELRWLRVTRAGAQRLSAEWHWADPASARRRLRDCHVMFVRSAAGPPVDIRRVSLEPAWRQDCLADGLSPDSTYRVCLQCTRATSAAENASILRPPQQQQPLYCADASTGLPHVSAGAGSAVGAALALLAVLALLLASRRARRCRKVSQRQSSAKRLLHDAPSPTGGNSPAHRTTAAGTSSGSEDEGCGSVGGCGGGGGGDLGDRSTTPASDETMTLPPLPPPPPPPLATPSLCETDDETAVLPLLSPLPPQTLPIAVSAGPPEQASASAILDLQPEDSRVRRVIRVNGTDEYSIDLRLCEALLGAGQCPTAPPSTAPPLFTQLIETL